MRIDILPISPAMFRGPFEESIVKRAVEKGLVDIHIHDIRQWASDRHRTVDDYPYGGGPGMGMKPEPPVRGGGGGVWEGVVVGAAVVRELPGALGAPDASVEESFTQGLLEYPQYTRPADFRGLAAPEVLLSGHHREIARWAR